MMFFSQNPKVIFLYDDKPYMLMRQSVCADERVNSGNSFCKFSFSSKGYLTAILGNSLAQCDFDHGGPNSYAKAHKGLSWKERNYT